MLAATSVKIDPPLAIIDIDFAQFDRNVHDTLYSDKYFE